MDLRSLRYFSEIAEAQSFSRAAARLRRSQPALSRCVQELESEMGVRLFDRTGRRIALTPNGRALLERVHRLLGDADALAEHAGLLAAGKTSALRIGGTTNFIERVLPDVLKRYRTRWPQVEIFLEPMDGQALFAGLERGEIDVAITRYAHSGFLEAELAFPLYVLAVVPRDHPLSKKASLGPLELKSQRILIAPSGMVSRRLFDAACRASGVRPQIAFESAEFNALVALVEAQQGIAVVPSTVETRGRAVNALPVFHRGKPLGSWTALVWHKRREQPDHAKDFVQQACRYLKNNYPGDDLELPLPEAPTR